MTQPIASLGSSATGPRAAVAQPAAPTAQIVLDGTPGDDILSGTSGNDVLYGGAGNDRLSAGSGDDTLGGGAGADELFGGRDLDMADYSDSNAGVNINLEGNSASGGHAQGDTIDGIDGVFGSAFNDRLIGYDGQSVVDNIFTNVFHGGNGDDFIDGAGGNDTLFGDGGDDTLLGGDGNDHLDGGAGLDRLEGGAGNDVYMLGTAGDTVVEFSGAGVDEVNALFSYTLAAFVERLVLTGAATINGTGNGLDNRITGNGAANTLVGGAGHDILDGGLGLDRLEGGVGNDTYFVDSVGDAVVEAAGAGFDQVNAGFSYTLSANVERLLLTGTVAINGTGNLLDNRLTGNSAANELNGGDGNDVLDGGLGLDRLQGGAGDDTYILATAGDTVVEGAGAGFDQVNAGVSYTLGANVERLLLTGTVAINGTGNLLDNRLTGNSAANVLKGGAGNDILDGGLGLDRLEGGVGNDTYILATAGDTVVEGTGAGLDQVSAGFSYILGANVERLLLTGTAAINGTGNALDNRLTGNSAANVLKGGIGNDILDGGLGLDRLEGGAGNDTYVLAAAGDTVVEGATGGIDIVQSAVNLTLAAFVENLVLTGTAANGTGNGLNNRITGNGVVNTLSGGTGHDVLDGGLGFDKLDGGAGNDTLIGGSGKDTLTGGLGNDAFQFLSAAEAGGDVITDFANVSGNNDLFRISASGFGAGLVAGGTLAASQFQARADNLAQDSNDRFIFRTTDQTLWFDSNGSAAGGLTLIADLQAGANVTSADILLI